MKSLKHRSSILKIFLITIGLVVMQGVCFSQTQVLVLNKSDNSLSVLDAKELTPMYKVTTGESPHELVVYPHKQWAIVANYGNQQPGNSLSIIDLKQRKEMQRVDLGPIQKPHGVALKGHSVYFTAERSRMVGRYDLQTLKLTWLQGTGQNGTHLLVLHPRDPVLFTSNRLSNTVTRISVDEPDLPEHIRQVPAGLKPEGIDCSPDGQELWVGSNEQGIITVFDASTLQQKTELATGGMPIRIKFSPDQQWVLVSDSRNGELLLYDAVTQKLKTRLNPGGIPMGIIIAADSRVAYIALSSSNEVIKISLPDLKIVARGQTGMNPDGIGLLY
jgi:YVTN family beta-propeller protein